MSEYVFPEHQEVPSDYRFDLNLDFDFDQWIDPALLSLHAPDGNPDLIPAARDLRPVGASQFGTPISSNLVPITWSAVGTEDTWHIPFLYGYVDQKLTSAYSTLPTKPNLECDFPGCTHQGTFARKFELKRHVKSKHGGARAYTCGAIGCFKRGNTRWSFSRLDKLTDHIRAVHVHTTPFSGCPVDGCNFGPHPLDMLGAHIQRAHPRCETEARSIVNATTANRRKCPLSGCNNKLFSLENFLLHLKNHEAEDLQAATSNACFESIVFDFINTPATGGATTTKIDVSIVCPVCLMISPAFEQFHRHFWASHLFLDPSQGTEHFFAWRDALKHASKTAPISKPWDNSAASVRVSVQCPNCVHSISGSKHAIQIQHPGLLKPNEQVTLELMPFRMQILRLYPDFLTHFIFDDCV